MSLRDAILARAAERPDAPALVWHDEETSYGRLLDAARRQQERMGRLGLAEGVPVGVLATKSPEVIALVLGSFLAGRRLLLPSPAMADDTLRTLFAQAGCRHVLAPDGPAWPPPPDGGGDGDGVAGDPPLPAAPPPADDVAIMLTTSGSTGLPKVVPLGWGAVDRFVAWAGEHFAIRPGTTVLNYAPLNFDLCLLDVWTTLARGGRVVLVDPDRAAHGRHLVEQLARHEVEVVQAVPLFYRLLLDADTGTRDDADADGAPPRLDRVRHAVFTGDAIPERTLAGLPRLFPAARLSNVYGCTETNDSFVHELDPAAPPAGPVPLGRPIPGVDALVVGDDGAVVTGEGAGELWVATPFQATGYLDPARDAGRFGPHPQGADGRTYFRTGDLVRRRADGQVVLQGRSDFQVKVRGVAINTAEVERVLVAHPEVAEAAVVAVPDPLAGRRLHGVVRREAATRLNSLALRRHCARLLPQAAIPSSLRIVDDPLPRTSTGKVDRTAVERTGTDHHTKEG